MIGKRQTASPEAVLTRIVRRQKEGRAQALYAACTASPLALRAVLRQAAADGATALIESTAAQVNLAGGYAGLPPQRFGKEVRQLAAGAGLAPGQVILGGDHLGPHLWRHKDGEYAMRQAAELTGACASAGYQKLHLDTATPCRNDLREPSGALPLDLISERAALLCRAAEAAVQQTGGAPPWYVIGSDVPPPGGGCRDGDDVPLSAVHKLKDTVAAHRRAFKKAGLDEAWDRVFAVVVYTGADFSPLAVQPYDSDRVQPLVAAIRKEPGLVFEAHATDFQTAEALSRMVGDHFGILKVGPALTFAMRQALFALADLEEAHLGGGRGIRLSRLPAVMEALMLADPAIWRPYYRGTPAEQAYLRRNAYSDRIRYYWFDPRAKAAVGRLMRNLKDHPAPLSLVDQYLPEVADDLRAGALLRDPERIVLESIGRVAAVYARACRLSAT
jgi:D-tagatose-1,6-bisphosphate aldolase subunit GatZ/KbaZ